jgi:uncharacterized protein (TIGR04222 family)
MRRQGQDNPTLWTEILAFRLDAPQASDPFSQRLARENVWPARYTARVIEEYKRFVYLAMIAEHPVTPSDAVDQAWHLHLCYTRSYWEDLCRDVLGAPLHHGPSRGGNAEHRRYAEQYEQTVRLYAAVFGEPVPADIWPEPCLRFRVGVQYRRINITEHWTFRKPSLWLDSRGAVHGRHVVSLVAFGFASAVCIFDAGAFMVLYWASWTLGVVLALRLRAASTDATARRASAHRSALQIQSVAYLSGGATRAVSCALASLMASNLVRLDAETGTLCRTEHAAEHLSPLEQSLYLRVASEPTLITTVRAGSEADTLHIQKALENAGYLEAFPADVIFWTAFCMPLIGLLMEFVLGNLSSATRGGSSFGVLCILCFVAYWIAKGISKPSQGPNAFGQRALAEWEQKHAELRVRAIGLEPPIREVPLIVAVFGLAALNAATWDLLEPPQVKDESSCGGGCGCG